MDEREQLILELPKYGPVSWDSIQRCARDAGMTAENWTFDALASYVTMHESSIRAQQAEVWPPRTERKHVPAWKIRLGEWLLLWSARLTDDGTENT